MEWRASLLVGLIGTRGVVALVALVGVVHGLAARRLDGGVDLARHRGAVHADLDLSAGSTARARFGKLPQAYGFARDLAEYVNERHPQVAMSAYSNDLIEFGSVHWFTDYPDAATYERVRLALLEDAGYVELYERANDLFLEDSVDQRAEFNR